MIHFACPSCRATYKVEDEFAGRRTKCRRCGQALQLSAVVQSAVLPVQVVVPPPAPPVKRRYTMSRFWKGVLLIVLLPLLVTVIGGILVEVLKPREPGGNAAPALQDKAKAAPDAEAEALASWDKFIEKAKNAGGKDKGCRRLESALGKPIIGEVEFGEGNRLAALVAGNGEKTWLRQYHLTFILAGGKWKFKNGVMTTIWEESGARESKDMTIQDFQQLRWYRDFDWGN
jgi:predicted Zn finger-like uncharacterized protein